MRIDKMAAWIRRSVAGSERLQLCWEGPTQLETLTDWTFPEMKSMAEGGEEIAETICTMAQEHCDAQDPGRVRTKYVLRWIGSDSRVLRSTMHHVQPTPANEEDPLGAAMARVMDDMRLATDEDGGGTVRSQAPMFYEAMIKELGRALLDKDRAMNEAYKTALNANQRTIDMLTAQVEAYFRQLSAMRAELLELQGPQPEVMSEAQAHESMKRAEAIDKLMGFMPEFTETLMHLASAKLLATLEPADGAKGEAPQPNGHAGAT